LERLIALTCDENGRLDIILCKAGSISRTQAKEQIEAGRILVNGARVTKPAFITKEGDMISGSITDTKPLDITPVACPLDILFEDEELIVLNKRQGVVVHPANTGENTLVHYLLHHFKNSDFALMSDTRPGIVHRLDRGTSGVLLVAKNRKSLDCLAAQFKNREVKKVYECIVWGVTAAEGSFRFPVGRDPVDRKRMSIKARHARDAVTDWRRLEVFTHFSHLEVRPLTGRTHQIRVHLSAGGNPILGDSLYVRSGLQRKMKLSSTLLKHMESIAHTLLHARSVSFLHPATRKFLEISAPRPPLFDDTIELLRKYDR
jgi:23S rRNA pseudouridine1911/1915/1917 synthase